MKLADSGGNSTVSADGAPELSACSYETEDFLEESTIIEMSTNNSLPIPDLGCHRYCNEEDRKCEDMLSEGPKSSKISDEGEQHYNEARSGNSSNWHTNVLYFDIDDDQDPVESQFGTVLNPMSNPVNISGKVVSYSSDIVCELYTHSDMSELKMKDAETNIFISCLDFEYHGTGSQDAEESDCSGPFPSQVDSDCGHGEANLFYELKDWSADNEDLENVHLSIIERFLSTTSCSNSEPCLYSEKCDESDCWNLDGNSSDYDLQSAPINSYEQYPYFLNECSGDDNFPEACALVTAVKGKGVIRFNNDRHPTNCDEGIKQTTCETGSHCEQETFDRMPIQCSDLDREFHGLKRPISHAPLDKLETNQGEEEGLEAKSAETDVLILKDHEVVKSNQSKTCRSPILKSVMGGAALIGMVAFFLRTRAPDKSKINKPDSEPPHLRGGNMKFSSHKSNNAVTKKGVYAAEKLKFS
uniref:Uncharacterized protein n=1 Tax=Kalanchoe fedtschenkoi TaxID=63787 RepID=A0A7N0USH6_KALFE